MSLLLLHLRGQLREHVLHEDVDGILCNLWVNQPLLGGDSQLYRKRRVLIIDRLRHILVLNHFQLHLGLLLGLRLLRLLLLLLLPTLFNRFLVRQIRQVQDNVKDKVAGNSQLLHGIDEAPHLGLPLRRTGLRISDDNIKLALR